MQTAQPQPVPARHILSHRVRAAKKRVWFGLERDRTFIIDGFRSQETTFACCVEISRKGLQTFLKNAEWMLLIQPGRGADTQMCNAEDSVQSQVNLHSFS